MSGWWTMSTGHGHGGHRGHGYGGHGHGHGGLEGQMPCRTNACTGICPSRHLSSRHLSVEAFVRPGICPARHLSAPPPRISVGSGICPDQMWVQAFVLLAFVRPKIYCRHLSSWHLSGPKLTPGICPTKN